MDCRCRKKASLVSKSEGLKQELRLGEENIETRLLLTVCIASRSVDTFTPGKLNPRTFAIERFFWRDESDLGLAAHGSVEGYGSFECPVARHGFENQTGCDFRIAQGHSSSRDY